MSFELTEEEGSYLVKLARKAIENYLKTGKSIAVPKDVPPKLTEKCGVFVTLNTISSGRKELRGCIGFPRPVMPLVKATIDSAISAAVGDPRFPQLELSELSNIVVEVSVLTPPELINAGTPSEYPKLIRIGRDGLIVERGWNSGLLLPQVPVEWDWNEEEFLSHCCLKAGLPPDSWLVPGTKIYRFQAIIFEEETPDGKVKRVQLSESG
ncbi:TIGR00296 family protein [Candidatus Bathyarchaeota archaeon]|nr:TIGR00296 family protein [Candidatus Bathyarchaeota archaeon]